MTHSNDQGAIQKVLRIVNERQLGHVTLGYVDLNGRLRAKRVAAEHLAHVMNSGMTIALGREPVRLGQSSPGVSLNRHDMMPSSVTC